MADQQAAQARVLALRAQAKATRTLSFRRGEYLAVKMLRELESDNDLVEECQYTAPYYAGKPQRLIAMEYIDKARLLGEEAYRGFRSVLSTCLATGCNGGFLNSDHYVEPSRSRLIGYGEQVVLDEAQEVSHA